MVDGDCMATPGPALRVASVSVAAPATGGGAPVDEQMRRPSPKATLQLFQSSVCKVGDNSSSIGPPRSRAPLFENRTNRTSSVLCFFSGNGLAPLFAVVKVTPDSGIVLGSEPSAVVRYVWCYEWRGVRVGRGCLRRSWRSSCGSAHWRSSSHQASRCQGRSVTAGPSCVR